MPREVTLTKTADRRYVATVGNRTLDLDPVELWLLLQQAKEELEPPLDQHHRLRQALDTAAWELRDILGKNPTLTRAYDLTRDDLKAVVDLSIRVASPWE
ncbi:MAG: hypothetical protein KDB70_04950 [Mycobacterium sp.]|nr:hypothetical protein [Mycobacterium sp.]